MQEEYESLINAIIQQTVEDYLAATETIVALEHKMQITDFSIKLVRKPNESSNNYRVRRYRHSKTYFERQIIDAKAKLEECEKFLKGDLIKQLSEIDGEVILAECKRKAEKIKNKYKNNKENKN